ncbi:MAG: MarR family transcriptional regulator [Puniceicoccaceae bacterium]
MDDVFPMAREADDAMQALSYELRVLSAIRRIARSVDVYSKRVSQRYGVTVPQLICLLRIDEMGSLSIKELATAVNLSPSVVVGIVDRLEKQEYVVRERSIRDRRIVRVLLTERAKALIANSPSPLQENLKAAVGKLPELERATIALSLEKVCALMESERVNPEMQGSDAALLDIATV